MEAFRIDESSGVLVLNSYMFLLLLLLCRIQNVKQTKFEISYQMIERAKQRSCLRVVTEKLGNALVSLTSTTNDTEHTESTVIVLFLLYFQFFIFWLKCDKNELFSRMCVMFTCGAAFLSFLVSISILHLKIRLLQ